MTHNIFFMEHRQGKLKRGMSNNDVTVHPWLPFKKNGWYFCYEQLHRQIIHQNARIFFYRHYFTITTSTFDVKFKENNENDMTFVA